MYMTIRFYLEPHNLKTTILNICYIQMVLASHFVHFLSESVYYISKLCWILFLRAYVDHLCRQLIPKACINNLCWYFFFFLYWGFLKHSPMHLRSTTLVCKNLSMSRYKLACIMTWVCTFFIVLFLSTIEYYIYNTTPPHPTLHIPHTTPTHTSQTTDCSTQPTHKWLDLPCISPGSSTDLSNKGGVDEVKKCH